MTQMDIEVIDLTDIVGDHEISCDYQGEFATSNVGDHDDPAKWVMVAKCHQCQRSPLHLACDRCKNSRTVPSIYIECHACGYVAPGPLWYTRIEAL